VVQGDIDAGRRPGTSTAEASKVKDLEREVRELKRANEILLKSTTTDEHAFDIGESELRAARTAPKGRYRILFIEALLQPAHRRLLVLPNPLEAASAAAYEQVNQGMRLRFEPP